MQPATYGVRAASGAAWSIVSAVVSKLAGLGSQLVLGWLLSKEDFGVYALAISTAWVAGIFADGGTRKILLQQGERYAELARPAFKLSLAINATAAVILAMAAPAIASLYRTPELTLLLWIICGSMILTTFGAVQRIRLLIDLRFRASSMLVAGSAILRQVCTVVLALLGFGPLSFVLPLLLVATFEAVVGRMIVGPLPRGNELDWQLTKYLLGQSPWLIISALALALSFQGDYLVVGAMQTPAVLGAYFFAFQLTYALTTPLGTAIRSVLLPSFARLKDDTARQAKAFSKSARIAVVMLSLAAAFLVVLAEPLIHLLWAGKWDDATLGVQALGVGLPFRLLAPISISLVESRGHWRAAAFLTAFAAVGTLGAAALGASLGGATSIAICISVQQVVVGVVQSVFAARVVGLGALRFVATLGLPMVLASGAASLTLWLMSVLACSVHVRLIVAPLLLAVALCVVARLVIWQQVKECATFVASMRGRRGKSVPETDRSLS